MLLFITFSLIRSSFVESSLSNRTIFRVEFQTFEKSSIEFEFQVFKSSGVQVWFYIDST